MWLEEQEEFLTDAMTTAFESAGLDGKSEDERLKEVLSNPSLMATVAEGIEDLTPLARLEAEKQIEDGLRVLAARGKEKAKVTRENVVSNGEARFATNGTNILGEPGTDPSAVARSIADRIGQNAVDLDNETGQKVIGHTIESVIADLDQQVTSGDLTGAQAAFFIGELESSLLKKGGGSVLDKFDHLSSRLDTARFMLSEGADQSKKDEKKAQAISSTRTFIEISLMEDLDDQEAAYGQMENSLRAAVDGTLTDDQAERLRAIDVDPESLSDIRIAQATVEAQRERDRSLDGGQRRRSADNRKANDDAWMREVTGQLARGEITRVEAVKMSESGEHYAAADTLRNRTDQDLRRNQELMRSVNMSLSVDEEGNSALDNIRIASPQVYSELLFSENLTAEEIHKQVKVYSRLGVDTATVGTEDARIEVPLAIPGSGPDYYEANGIPIKQASRMEDLDSMHKDLEEVAAVGFTVTDGIVSVDPEAQKIMAEKALYSGQLRTDDTLVEGLKIKDGDQEVPVSVELLPTFKTLGWNELLQLRFSDVPDAESIDPGWWTKLSNGGSVQQATLRNLKQAYRRYSKHPLSDSQVQDLLDSYAYELDER
jgi:hypothetical protein